MISPLDLHGLQQPILNALQCVMVGQNRKILCLALELLIRIYTRSKHLGSSSRAHLSHLLLHLACSYTN